MGRAKVDNQIGQADLRSIFDYHPETGRLSWKVTPTNRHAISDEVGWLEKNGRRRVEIGGKRYWLNRLIWVWMTGNEPHGYIRFRDGNYENLRWGNLYDQTPSDAAATNALRATNKSGYRGVSWDRVKRKWHAQIHRGYRQVHLGYFADKEAASAAVERARIDVSSTIDESAAAQAKKLTLWRRMRRDHPAHAWRDLAHFMATIGDVPDGRKYQLETIDESKPIGPGNFEWARNARKASETTRAAYERARRNAHPEMIYAAYDLKRNFGITVERYKEMLLEQNGVCAICGKPETAIRNGRVLALCVDHDHETGQIRDLKCRACNNGIGHFADSPELLRAAADNLERHKARAAEALTNVVSLRPKGSA